MIEHTAAKVAIFSTERTGELVQGLFSNKDPDKLNCFASRSTKCVDGTLLVSKLFSRLLTV